MDGVGGLTQPYIKAGETARYEWTLRQYGTFMFHAHHDEMTQMGMGLIGMFVVHPRHPAPHKPGQPRHQRLPRRRLPVRRQLPQAVQAAAQ